MAKDPSSLAIAARHATEWHHRRQAQEALRRAGGALDSVLLLNDLEDGGLLTEQTATALTDMERVFEQARKQIGLGERG